MVGPSPFTLGSDGKLSLALEPVIANWMWRDDGTLMFKFLGEIQVRARERERETPCHAAAPHASFCALSRVSHASSYL